ncbi:MAG: MFS transporter [Micrococcales bacterium]|nr:MAG: MFS transporter [Micrococcales bacterium]PIE26888.1 MAG: MFS transporter [Micrococcales bacterium]
MSARVPHGGLLAIRPYRWLLACRVGSQLGDGVFQAGLVGWLFFQPARQATPGAAATAAAASLLPYTVVGPFAGVILDRVRRSRTIVVANVVRAAVTVLIAAATVAQASVLLIGAAVLACLSLNRFFLAGQTAGIPHTVPPRLVVSANAATPTAGTIAAVAGGTAAATWMTWSGTTAGHSATVLSLAACCYLASAGLTLPLGRDGLGPGRLRRPNGSALTVGLRQGFAHVYRHPVAKAALAAVVALRVAVGLLMIATLILARNHLTDPATPQQGLGVLTACGSAAGVGAVLAAVLTPTMTRRLGIRGWSQLVLGLAAAAMAAVVLAASTVLLVFVSAMAAMAAMAVKIGVDSTLHATVEDRFRGRVFALYDAAFNAAFVVAAALAAVLLPADGYSRTVFAFMALLLMGAALVLRPVAVTATAPRS